MIKTKPRTHPTARLALANADEWTGEGGVGKRGIN